MQSSIRARKSIRNRHRRRAQFLAILLGAAPLTNPAFGQETYWNISTAVANNWVTATNWVPAPTGGTGGVVPNLTITANFSSDAASLAGTRQIFLSGNRSALGLVFNAPGPFLLRSNQTATTVQTITLMAGGITVNASSAGVSFQTTVPGVTTSSGQVNTLLAASQTWTNHSTGALDWNGRIAGTEAVTLTKTGTGTLVLRANNSTTVGTTSGLRGKIQINQGLVSVAQANALGIKDVLTSETTSAAAIATLVSDTTIASGAALDVNNISLTNEFISVSGSGINGSGAIVNNQTGTGINNGTQQVRLVGDTTFGGATAKWDIRGVNAAEGRFFQDGFTLTKTGGNIVSITNTNVYGGGNINVNEGTLRLEAGTNITDGGTITVQSGGILQFTNVVGDISRAIVLPGNSQIQNTGNDTITRVNSGLILNGPSTLSVVDNNNATAVGALHFDGLTTGTADVIKVGSGRLGLNLSPTYTGTINVQGGGFDLTTSAGAIANNINLFDSNAGIATIFRVSVGGEGQTTGTLRLGGAGIVFDPTTTGAGQHLRVGAVDQTAASVPTVVRLKSPITSGTGLVVFESAANDLLGPNVPIGFLFQGRQFGNGLTWNSSQVLLDYQAGVLKWTGTDLGNGSLWDVQTTANWSNGGTTDVFYDLDIVTFDDSVGIGSTLVAPQGLVAGGITINFNNNAANYTITPADATGAIEASQSTLDKTGTGSLTINTIAAGAAHAIRTLNAQSGVVEFGFTGTEGLGNVASQVNQILISSGATVRNKLNIANSGMGVGFPVNIAAGGVYELSRSGVNGTVTTTAATALTNPYSGAGDIVFNGTTTSLTTHLDSYGAFTMNGQNSGFTGRWVLNNARINADNAQGDELGAATIVAPSGSAALLNGTIPHEGNIFQIAGNGWASEPTASLGGQGALRLNAAGATVGATSQVQLSGDARILGSALGNIRGPITGGFNILYGNPEGAANGTLILTGNNTYTGNATITNHTIGASANNVFGTGTVNLAGNSTARVTQLNITNGVTVSNPIVLNSFAGQAGRGAIEGAGAQQVLNNGAGVGTVAGTITLANLPANWGHFGSGAGTGAALRVTGVVNVPDPVTDPVVHRSSTAAGYTEFTGSGGNYTRFDLSGGTIRLGIENALKPGIDLITRNVGARGDLDLRGFNHTFNSITRGSTVGGSTFNLVNSVSGTATITITGNTNSEIQNIPVNVGGGTVNIVKTGSGNLILTGSTANLANPGTYTVSGGTFGVTAGQMAAGAVNATNVRMSGGGTGGVVTMSGGGFSPGATDGALFESGAANLVLANGSFFQAEPLDPPAPPGSQTLDLAKLINIHYDGNEPTVFPKTIGPIVNFDPNINYAWNLIAQEEPISGLDSLDFVIDTSIIHLPLPGTFRVEQSSSGTSMTLVYNVPEPSSLVLLVSGFGIALLRTRRRHK